MREIILKVLKNHFHYNDYKLGKIANDIEVAIKEQQLATIKSCSNCIYRNTLIVTYVGETPNLCQRGRKKGDAINCPYYMEGKNGVNMYEEPGYSSITKTFR